MLPPAYLLSAAGREAILAGTLARWAETDWATPPVIHLDPATGGEARSRIPAAWHSMLVRALAETSAPFMLLLEDDLAFHRRLRAAVLRWPPLVKTASSLSPACMTLSCRQR